MTRTRLSTFTWAYLLAFATYGAVQGNRRFVAYFIVVGALAWLIRRVHRIYPFPTPTLWAFSACGLLHMIGGLMPSPSPDAPIFYETWIVEPILKYDQFVHFTISAVVAVAAWQLLGHLFGRRAPLARVLIAATFAFGFGGLNEAFEFLSAQRFADALVGDMQNTGWDLVFNTFGALTAAVWLYIADGTVAAPRPSVGEFPRNTQLSVNSPGK